MNKLLLFSIFTLLILSSCIKETTDKSEQEKTDRENYIKNNNITVSPTASGLYFIEGILGTGATPTKGVKVKVGYTGKLLNGQEFDSGEVEYRFSNNEVIIGFDEAVSYMRKGGKAKAIIPSYLAYGALQKGIVPSYSTLVFDLELQEVFGKDKEIEDREKYLTDNNIETLPTESGLYYIETAAGEGELTADGDYVTIRYKGKYLDNTVFDEGTISFNYNDNKVIKGIDEALGYMKAGGKASIIVPSELGYGPIGGQTIPGYTTLLFDIELIGN